MCLIATYVLLSTSSLTYTHKDLMAVALRAALTAWPALTRGRGRGIEIEAARPVAEKSGSLRNGYDFIEGRVRVSEMIRGDNRIPRRKLLWCSLNWSSQRDQESMHSMLNEMKGVNLEKGCLARHSVDDHMVDASL